MELEPRHRKGKWTTAHSGNRAQLEDRVKGQGGGAGGVQLSWMFNSQGTEAVRKARGRESRKPERRWGRSWAVQEINGQRQGPHAPLREDFQES